MSTPKITRTGNTPCGTCMTGHHNLCKRGILNGDEVTVIVCPCPEHEPAIRCLGCGLIDPTGGEVSADTWSCADFDSCSARRQASRERVRRELWGDTGTPPRAPARETHASSRMTPRKTAGACLHCNEPTKGGMFLPGHDAIYLSERVAHIRSGGVTLEETLAAWQSVGVSEALQNKLARRVAT